MNDTQKIKTIIEAAEIPSIPHILQSILSLADDPRTSSSDLEKLVTKEPGLITHLLQLVNSAYYCLPQRISSIKHSMILLGFSTVKCIAAGLVLIDTFNNLTGLDKGYVIRVWRHGLQMANLMALLTRRETLSKRDDLFLAAMIHDVGHLVMSQHFKKEYHAAIREEPFPTPEAESRAFGVHHEEVAAAFLDGWKFPESVIAMVRHHHSPASYDGDRRDIDFLDLAEALVLNGGQLELLLSQTQETVDPRWPEQLGKVGWEWKTFSREKTNILHALSSIEHLLPES